MGHARFDSQRRGRHVSIPSFFASSSCAASVFPCLLLLAIADVAVSWTSLAIIAQRAPQWERLGGVGLHWSQPASRVFREAGGRVRTNVVVRELRGEQGDALMPALFSLGQHGALERKSC